MTKSTPKTFAITGGRQTGKTTELIRRAVEEDLYIVCSTAHRCDFLVRQASAMGLNMRHPITARELPLRSPHIHRVLIEDAFELFEHLVGKQIRGMNIGSESLELIKMSIPPRESDFTITDKVIESEWTRGD